jgi:ribonuclease R
VLEYIRAHPNADKRTLMRAFGVKGEGRRLLKDLLRGLADEGLLETASLKKPRLSGHTPLPSMLVVDVVAIDPEDGSALLRPATWDDDRPVPRMILAPGRGAGAPSTGDRLLVRLEREGPRKYSAIAVRRLDKRTERCVGQFARDGRRGGTIRPTDRRQKEELSVGPEDTMDAADGELVLAEVNPAMTMGARRAVVIERLGPLGAPKSISLIAILANNIPTEFPVAAIKEAEAARPVTPEGRVDLRDLPLVTIDGADARDFDDAVFAEPDYDRANRGGWHLIVAIADVAHYVKPDSALDKSAYERGNSVYFADRVVPMLPEALSNDLCSLRPDEDRACMAVHIWIDAKGNKLSHRFVRGVMRSAARLTYEQAQAICDGALESPLAETVVRPLYGAYAALTKAREARGTLDLDLPEHRVMVDFKTGAVTGVTRRERLDSHRLIEEFMISANVCAAESLEAATQPLLYRVHDQPPAEKVAALAEFLRLNGFKLAKGDVMQPRHFMGVLRQAAGTPQEAVVHESVLRAQSQAVYSPHNLGHFGLALRRYAHFTSPIRRYADLIVHRALIRALGFGSDGISPAMTIDALESVGTHISMTERRAADAERAANDRFIAVWLAGRRGEGFQGRVSGVGSFGLFVRLLESGADGLVPMRRLPNDYYDLDEAGQRLVGARSGRVLTLGDVVSVQLAEVDVLTGSVTFDLIEGGTMEPIDPRRRGKTPIKGVRHPFKRGRR